MDSRHDYIKITLSTTHHLFKFRYMFCCWDTKNNMANNVYKNLNENKQYLR